MTKEEWNYVNEQYVLLSNKKDRSVIEELQYDYFDKLITYTSLVRQAKELGNKNPQDNCLVADAREHVEKAEQKFRDYCRIKIGGWSENEK